MSKKIRGVVDLKKVVALLLTLCMLFSVVIPTQSFAQEKELEEVIKSVKQKVDVPEKLTEFNYSVFTQQDKNVWNLSWNSKDSNDGNVNMNVLDDGTIQNYNYYKGYSNPQNQGKLPKMSRQDAQKLAETFIRKVNPEIIPQLKIDENSQQSLMDNTYNFNFLRYVNNIPFRANNVSVDVNLQDGYVQSFYRNWNDDLQFPSSNEAISLEDAKKAYKEKLGLTLLYNYRIEDEKIVTYLAYQPKYDSYYIDALTGEKVKLQNDNYYPRMADGMGNMKESVNSGEMTPQEQNAVDEMSTILNREQVEKIARDNQLFGLTEKFKVSNAGLYKDWLPSKNLTWNLDFLKDGDNGYRNVSVRLDAKTGEILSFYINSSNNDDAFAKLNKEESKADVQKFLNEFCLEKFKNTVFDENFEGFVRPIELLSQKELPKSYNFRYLRKVNGIAFLGNFLNVGFDSVSGKVTSLDSQWFDAKFDPLDKTISVENAYDKLFKEIGYDLQYRTEYNPDINMKYPTKDIQLEVKLVYAPNPKKPALIDALKGIVLNNDGTPYKDNKTIKYSDIESSFAKNEISFLSQYGIAFDGEKFRPTYKITQKEFLYLIAKVQNPYEQYALKNKKDTERLYSYLIRDGIVKESEKAPNAIITKEETAKFIIRVMKYDRIAELKDVLNCNFEDKESMNPDLIGYITLANGLGIVKGDDGKFNPKLNVTREQAAVIIYNFLKK